LDIVPILWVFLGLFCLRVLGQILVAFFDVSFLPPMEQWYSGLLAYPYLLASQILIIGLMMRINVDFTRGHGLFVRSHPWFGQGVLYFGYAYLAVMIVRYLVTMWLYPDQRWFGGSIPIVFHWMLASYVILFGQYHRHRLHGRAQLVLR
jgi:hypothetical protein